jgi:hypothetical protein
VSGHDDAGDDADDADDERVESDSDTEDVGTDLPPDVEDTLTQLLTEGAESARRRDPDEVSAVVDTVRTVAENELPASPLRERLIHGCATVDRLAADEPLVAAEYLDAMGRLVRSA